MLPSIFKNNSISQLFENFSSLEKMFDNNFSKNDNVFPMTNIKETDKAYIVEIAVPGIKKESCEIKIDNDNNLCVSIKNKTESENKTHNYLKYEFGFYDYERKYSLPENTDKENINATVENGILQIDLPKNKIKKNTKTIEIK